MKTINLIYNPEEIEEIRTKGQEIDNLCWWFGDKGIEAWKRFLDLKNRIIHNEKLLLRKFNHQEIVSILKKTQMEIFTEVGDEAGKSASTIKYWVSLAEYYQGDIREKYEVLPLSHYAFAKQFPEFSEQILEFSLKSMDGNGGKPRSKSYLEANLSKIIGKPALLEHLEQMQDVEASIEYADLESVVPEAEEASISPIVYHLVRQVPRVAAFLKNGIREWESISDHDREELFELVDRLEKKICELSKK